MISSLRAFSLGLLLAGPALAPAAAKDPAPKVVHLRTEPLRIATRSGARAYQVEVAATPDEQERGLMFRTAVPRHGGMIFPMQPPRLATFWMKNTLIPLDMVFIRADGTIARIAAGTTPYSLAPVSSGEPVAAVLELAGGEAARAGIAEGDKVSAAGLNNAR